MVAQLAFSQGEVEDSIDDAEVLEELDVDVQGSIDNADEKRGIAVSVAY
jgi:hypothetical protein